MSCTHFNTFILLCVLLNICTIGLGSKKSTTLSTTVKRDRHAIITRPPIVVPKNKGIYGNPFYMHDRHRDEIYKPQLPMESLKPPQPYHPAWMDYCDPYHCNDYHKTACGLNRERKHFKWFQSGCHLILANKCATYRGALKYDLIDPKYCTAYVLHLRSECPENCSDHLELTCAQSTIDGHFELFQNSCDLTRANCASATEMDEFDEVPIQLCSKMVSEIIQVIWRKKRVI